MILITAFADKTRNNNSVKHTIALKGFAFNEANVLVFQRRLEILSRRLIHFAEDLSVFSLTMKRHDTHNFYIGTMILHLPHKTMLVRLQGYSVNYMLIQGFEILEKEYLKYKSLHFKGDSMYPDHSTIRHL